MTARQFIEPVAAKVIEVSNEHAGKKRIYSQMCCPRVRCLRCEVSQREAGWGLSPGKSRELSGRDRRVSVTAARRVVAVGALSKSAPRRLVTRNAQDN